MAKWSVSDMGLEYYNPDEAVQTPLGMIKQYATVSGQTPNASLYARLIEEEFTEWAEECQLYEGYFNPEEIGYKPAYELKELADLLYVIYGYANARGWDVEEAFRRVHANNMGRMYQPDGTIKRREDGKVLRNSSYPKVDLSDLVQ